MKISQEMELYRLRLGQLSTQPGEPYGFFQVPSDAHSGRRPLDIIATDGQSDVGAGWEHVSAKVHIGKHTYTPTWNEMCWIKDQFWLPEDTVIQIHPAKSAYVKCHPDVLHLWRKPSAVIELPPTELIGPI